VAAAGSEVAAAAVGGQPGGPDPHQNVKTGVLDTRQGGVMGRADSLSHLQKDAFERGTPCLWVASRTYRFTVLGKGQECLCSPAREGGGARRGQLNRKLEVF